MMLSPPLGLRTLLAVALLSLGAVPARAGRPAHTMPSGAPVPPRPAVAEMRRCWRSAPAR